MPEWRIIEVNGNLLSTSSSDIIEDVPVSVPIQHQSQQQMHRRRRHIPTANTTIQISATTAAMGNGTGLAPLERFLEAGRQFQQQQQQQQTSRLTPPNQHLRNKIVFNLACRYCRQRCCHRAMRAILLADTKVELYSTDIPPSAATITGDDDRLTQGCHCRIRDALCRRCGNVLGYHVSQPCERCLAARNNGHFWMFYSEVVVPTERIDRSSGKPLVWSQLTPAVELDEDGELNGYFGDDEIGLIGGGERFCDR